MKKENPWSDEVEIDTFWTPQQPWGDDTFRIDGDLYRRCNKREKPDFTIESENGDVKLRRLTRGEERKLLHSLLQGGRKR